MLNESKGCLAPLGQEEEDHEEAAKKRRRKMEELEGEAANTGKEEWS